MENLRYLLLKRHSNKIPTKPMNNNHDGFYLFVEGGVDKVKGCKVKYRFPLIKKDLAMFVFYKLHDFHYECYKEDINIHEKNNLNEEEGGYYYITKAFLSTEFCKDFHTITRVSMVLCHGGKLSEVTYDPKYPLKGYEEILQQEGKPISNYDYQYK